MVETTCFYCTERVDSSDPDTWKQVTGWVGGPRKDGMTAREDTGRYAHNHCLAKVRLGQSPDQQDLFGEDVLPPARPAEPEPSIEEVLQDS
jgi:hypothetical protein